MRPTDRHEMFMDAIAWILHWGTSHGEFDESLKWTSSFLKYLCGFTTQAEENWFDERCNDFHVDMTSSSRRSYYMSCSKKLSNVLRHCRDKTLFNASGAMNISLLFDQMQGDNPKEYHMSGADFAAMLLCNPKQRFFVEISMRWQWYPYSPMAEYPFDVRLGAFQGHSNQVVDPTVAHHQLTYDEAMSLGWIFHVTDFMNLDSIQQSGLKTFVKGSGKGRRDAVHFMYHNDNGQGYIRMAEGTKPPRNYRRPVYLVLDPSFIVDNQLYLTKNGVILFHGDIPFQYLHVKEQLPTIACNVVHQGRGHSLPPSVTGGSWHRDTTWNHVMKEKGPTFIPGHDIPEEVRITAWEFMGQQVPQNYGRLVFGTPLCNENDFDPIMDSIYGAAAESSQEREVSAQDDDVPMRNPYEQPSRRGRSQEREEPQGRGRSQEREEPQDVWEQQRSSSGSPESRQYDDPQQDAQDNQQEEPSVEVQDDPMGEEAVNLWEAEDPPDDIEDPVVEQATKSSISASNPWVLYEAGIVCAREESGELIKNSSGEKVIVLREWNLLLSSQKIALRRQSITRSDWEKLPWTGHLCLLFTRAWEIGRMLAHFHRERNSAAMEGYLDTCRRHWTDWMRGQVAPTGWEDRHSISRDEWREKFLLYERDLAIQKDMEYLSEAVFVFYTKHLDQFIRENNKLWGDFCKRKRDRDGNILDALELNTHGYDMTIQGITVPMNKRTVIPEPERHFSFSTKMMIMAIDLYEDEAPASFCHFTIFALNKLRQFVDSRKELTAQSYRSFVEHAYNQFFQHEAFHQSARARTKVRECGTGDFHTSTKLDGYIWVAGKDKIAHIPESEQQNVDMEDHDDDDADEDELEFLPRLQVFVRQQEEKASGSHEREEEGVCSQEREETQPQQDETSTMENQEQHVDEVLSDENPRRNPEDRQGLFLVRQLKPEHRRILHDITLAGQRILPIDDLEGGQPLERGDISYFSLWLMMSALSDASFSTCMNQYAPMMGYEISYDTYYEFKLDIDKVLKDNEHLSAENFFGAEDPDLVDDDPNTPLPDLQGQSAGDPEYKHTIESLNIEDKHIILETDDDKLVECTLKWISMCNKNVQQKIKDSFVKQEERQVEEDEEEEIVVEEEEEKDTQEPHVPAESSLEKEEAAPPERSSEKEESGEKKADIQDDETAPEVKPAIRFYYGQDITGNEDDSVFRKLEDCFSDGYHGEWAGFYNKGYPASSKHRHMFWHVKYRKTMSPHQDYWYHLTDDQLMIEYIARHKDQNPQLELQELNNHIEYGCSDPRMHPLHQDKAESSSKEAEKRIDDDFGNLTKVLQDYVEDHKVLPYCMILHSLAYRYLGGGLSDPTYKDAEFPYRSSPQITAMFWNLGNWCRNRFEKCPVPERFQQFIPHIDYTIDEDHEKFDENKTQFNNYFINVIKNFGGHLFMNCEAGSLYPHRERLDEVDFKTCFNDYHDLMVAARLGKDGYIKQIAGYHTDDNDTRVRQVSWAIFEVSWGKTKDRDTDEIVDLTRARMRMTRVCVYHVGQKYASDSAGIVGECLAVMAFECARYQVDFIAGDGNKACYYSTPKSPGVPTYQHSLIQFWINRMVGVATQAMRKYFDSSCPPIRVKHFISCSYRDLDFLATHLDGITTATYTEELMNKTNGKGDCCMLTVVEWGHSRLMCQEHLEDFDGDEDRMNYVGEFYFKVNETCLHGDHNIFMVAPNDRDAHNPILIHLDPSDMSWNERHHYKQAFKKKQYADTRKERQKEKKRKGYEGQASTYQGNASWGGSSSSSSRPWRTSFWL